MKTQKLKWYQTKQGYAVLALLEFAAAYIFASLAIDSGRILEWASAIALLIAGIHNSGKLVFALWKHE